jgi:hypothetical protein
MSSLEISQFSQGGGNVSLPQLRFLHINDPSEAKLPSHRKAVHTHAALYQSSHDRTGRECPAKKKRHRNRKGKDPWPGESMIIELGQTQPAELWVQTLSQYCTPIIELLGAGRVDPFRTYPVPWKPSIPQLVDHCSSYFAFLQNHG